MTKEKTIHIVIIFMFCALISSCINTIENSLTASPHFRQVWWGSTKASVLTKEKGKRIKSNTGGALVYKTRYESIPVSLVYCFWQPQRYLSPSRSRVSDGNTCSDIRSQ